MLTIIPQLTPTTDDFNHSGEAMAAKESTPNAKVSEHEPKEFFLNIAARLKRENESERAREQSQAIYQMCRRHRGQLPSDSFGYWREGVWCESPAFSQLHGTNVFQSLIRGAEANFNQANISLDIKANRNNPETRSALKISKGIYDALKERQWTETVRQAAFFANILQLNAFYISRFDKTKGSPVVSQPNFEPLNYEEGGTFVCPECFATGDYSFQQTNACPECGNENLSILDEPTEISDQLVGGFDKKESGETELVIADGLDVSVDPGGRPADIKSCRWVEWRYLAQKNELKRLFPQLEMEGSAEWSYQTRLKMGLKRYERGEGAPTSDSDKSTYEIRQIWLDLTEYEDYIPPTNFKLGDVSFERGTAIKEQFPEGLVFGICGQELAFIDAEDKNKRVASSLWLSDGVSFVGLGARAGLPIQRKINMLDNMAMEGEARSLKGSIVYDPQAIDGTMLEGANTNIPLRIDYTNDKGIGNAVMPLTVEGLSQYSLAYLAGQKETMQEVMGVPDVALGQDTSSDKTFGGQMLRQRNASGLLIPATQSTARAMELWLNHQLHIIQEFYAPEALLEFGASNGEEWQPDEIEAFYNANLERDISIFYVPGSELPESRAEKQGKLRADIAAGFIQMTPELQSQMMAESGYAGLDTGGFESNRKLAEKRFFYLKESLEEAPAIEQAFEQYEQMLIEPEMGTRLTDETGNPVPNPVIQQILAAPEMSLYKEAENHEQHIEYWSAKVRLLASQQTSASKLFVQTCLSMIQQHQQAIFEMQMKGQTLAALAGAPSQMGQAMIEQEMAPAEPAPPPAKK